MIAVNEGLLERHLIVSAARRDPAHGAFDVLRTRHSGSAPQQRLAPCRRDLTHQGLRQKLYRAEPRYRPVALRCLPHGSA